MSAIAERLERALPGRVATDPDTLRAHRHDAWMLAELLDLEGRGAPSPACVVRARSTGDVSVALRACRELGAPVVPFGGGSGVCGAIECDRDTVVLATGGLSGLVDLDAASLVARFRAGTLGAEAERRVREAGLTVGHWPQSVDVSSVGGWVATRASGQYSTGYGNIEDLVLALEVVLPDGAVLRTRETPRASAGPDLKHLFLGSEGTLGVVTEVALSLRPLPEASEPQAFHFARFPDGLAAVRALVQAGWRPPVARLYDARESRRQFADWCPEGRALLLLLHEGPRGAVDASLAGVSDLCRSAGGEAAGAGSVSHWLEHRNRVPSFRELLERGYVADTVELAATWSRVEPLYDAVTRALAGVSDLRGISAHSSHSYRSGTCLYFTFAVQPADRASMAGVYRDCWRRILDAAAETGAGLAHHHGIGRVRRGALPRELGDTGVDLLRAVKRALDPSGLLNPGALLPD